MAVLFPRIKGLQLLWSPSRPEAGRKGRQKDPGMEGETLRSERMDGWNELKDRNIEGQTWEKASKRLGMTGGWNGWLFSCFSRPVNWTPKQWYEVLFHHLPLCPSILPKQRAARLTELHHSAISVFYKVQPILSCWDGVFSLLFWRQDVKSPLF